MLDALAKLGPIDEAFADVEPAGTLHQQMRERVKDTCEIITNPVVQAELLLGVMRRGSPRQMAAYELQMAHIAVLPIDESIAMHYAGLRTQLERAGTPIGPNDMLIAAHAISLDAVLVSADEEFKRVPGLKLENWLA